MCQPIVKVCSAAPWGALTILYLRGPGVNDGCGIKLGAVHLRQCQVKVTQAPVAPFVVVGNWGLRLSR